MQYVFDSSSFRVLEHYFPHRFPSFWQNLEAAVTEGQIISVREVYNELSRQGIGPHLAEWIRAHKGKFPVPGEEETLFVQEIFRVRHFQQLVAKRNQLTGSPVADPFVIAAAKACHGCVVTEEALKRNAARIPNVCEHFQIPWTNLEGFMEANAWRF